LVKIEGFLLSVVYNGESRKAELKFLDEERQVIVKVPDQTGHKPYCYSKMPKEELMKIQELTSLPGFEEIQEKELYDALLDKPIRVSRIVVSDPLSIGGRNKGTVREVLKEAWEADIPYVLNYIYDLRLVPGTYYVVDTETCLIEPLKKVSVGRSELKMKELIDALNPEEKSVVSELTRLLETPIPEIKRVALDIEVLTETPTRVPDPEEAERPIGAVSFMSSNGVKKVFLLLRDSMPKEDFKTLIDETDVEIAYFSDERTLIEATFKELYRYPMVVTFNGDNFDLPYLRNRARKLGILDQDIPIKLGRDYADVTTAVHVDLYKFFFNKSIQNYAFNGSYKEATLDAIGKAVLGKGKLELSKPINDLSYRELATYCFMDSEVTMGLTTFNGSIVIKLIFVLMRISRCPLEEIVRHAVSSWIRSLLLALHRENGLLIPNPEDIMAIKGETYSRAIIKGKKYMGAIVLEPTPGIHFNVVVMDFASLYPSVIDKFNLSYETLRCPHEECKGNLVPELPHWICTKKRGISSSAIGALRTLRVRVYVPLSKSRDIPKEERSRYDVIQRALKVFLNASYGVMGAESFQFYTPPLAESVTAIGRKLLTEVISRAQSMGAQVVYGDTDSVFLKNPPKDLIDGLTDWIKNKYGVDLNFDKRYRYVVFSQRKKNYFGVTEDGIVDIKGLIGKKSSTPEFAKRVFFDVLKILSEVSNEQEFEVAKNRVTEMIMENVDKIRRREVSIEDLAFNIMLSKELDSYEKTTPQHVKAAKQLAAYGYEYRPGDIISFVKTKGKIGVKPTRLANLNEIDVDKYVEILNSVFEQIAEPLGIDILGNTSKGTRLLDFM
jgi:DNA polymerase I